MSSAPLSPSKREPSGDSTALRASAGNYAYNETFYRYIQDGSIRSAQVVVPLVIDRLKISSVLDVGCGAGAWLREYHRRGISDGLGVDGDYVHRSSLLVPPEFFLPHDISHPFDIKRRFDLVQCLEVGEHIDPAASNILVSNLVRHSNCVLFSAAVPGQGGENHINERPYAFWRALFAEHGYAPYDFLRPLLRGRTQVECWYRHNIVLYVAEDFHRHLPTDVVQTRIPDEEPIPDVASPLYRLRTRLLAPLPVSWISQLAILKHRLILLSGMMTGQRNR